MFFFSLYPFSIYTGGGRLDTWHLTNPQYFANRSPLDRNPMEATIHPPSSISIPQYIFAQISGQRGFFYFPNPYHPILHCTPPPQNFKLRNMLCHDEIMHFFCSTVFTGAATCCQLFCRFCGNSLGNWASLGLAGWLVARTRAEKGGKLVKLELALEGGLWSRPLCGIG